MTPPLETIPRAFGDRDHLEAIMALLRSSKVPGCLKYPYKEISFPALLMCCLLKRCQQITSKYYVNEISSILPGLLTGNPALFVAVCSRAFVLIPFPSVIVVSANLSWSVHSVFLVSSSPVLMLLTDGSERV